MRVLITWGSKRGGTAGIGRIIGEQLQNDQLEVEMKPAASARPSAAYDAVIVGGALYANRWHRHARRFVLRNTHTLDCSNEASTCSPASAACGFRSR